MTTTISATATVRVRGLSSKEHAEAVARVLGHALSGALSAATIAPERKRNPIPQPAGER